MLKVKKLFVLVSGLIAIYGITAAVDKQENEIVDKLTHDSPTELNTIIEAGLLNECLDTAMTYWFESFNSYQDNGLSISKADSMAAENAIAFYKECR